MPGTKLSGARAKPNELHILEGTARKERGTDVVVELTDEKPPQLQRYVTDTDFALDVNRVFNQLSTWVRKVTGQAEIDEHLLSMLIDHYVIYIEAKKKLNQRGLFIPKADGTGEYPNPAVRVLNEAHDKILKSMREFGMTPATRGQLKASQQMDQNPLSTVMEGPKL